MSIILYNLHLVLLKNGQVIKERKAQYIQVKSDIRSRSITGFGNLRTYL